MLDQIELLRSPVSILVTVCMIAHGGKKYESYSATSEENENQLIAGSGDGSIKLWDIR